MDQIKKSADELLKLLCSTKPKPFKTKKNRWWNRFFKVWVSAIGLDGDCEIERSWINWQRKER